MATCASGSFVCAIAQQPILDPITVTAARVEQTRSAAMTDLIVIDRQQIEQAGAQTVAQLLAQFAGAEVAETGGQGRVTGLFLRGTKTAQSLVLLNGVRLENASSGGANLEFIPLGLIEKIEVVQGPASATYGSSAVGGVIHIFTRSDKPVTSLQASAGSNSTLQARAATAGVFSKGDWQVQVGSQRTGGFDATLPSSRNAQLDRDAAKQTHASANLRIKPTDSLTLGATALQTRGSADYDDSFSTADTAKLKFTNSQFGFFAAADVAKDWQSTVNLTRSKIAYEYLAFEFSPTALTNQVSWENTLTLNANKDRLVFGADLSKQSVKGQGVSYQQDQRDNRAAWLGWLGSAGAHQWRVQARHDAIRSPNSLTLKGNHYSVAYGFRLAPKTVVSISSASAFRAPTFDDLFSPFGGNPNLKVERSVNWELLLQHQQNLTDISLVLFKQVIRDAIELDADFSPQNQQRTTVAGATARISQRVNFGQHQFQWRGHITAQDPKGKTQAITAGAAVSETQLARRAKLHGGVSADWQSGPVNQALLLRAQAKRRDSDNSPMGAYAVADYQLRYSISPRLTAQFRVMNLANRQYQTASGYRSQPRAFEAGFNWIME